VDIDRVLEKLTTSNIILIMEAVSFSEISPIFTRLHGATSLKAAMFNKEVTVIEQCKVSTCFPRLTTVLFP
jgi:hypothetical protein